MPDKGPKKKMSNKKFLALWIPALCVVLALAVAAMDSASLAVTSTGRLAV